MRFCKSSKKAKFYSQECYFALSHPVPKKEDQLGMERRSRGRISYPLETVEGRILSLLLLCMLWCDLGPTESELVTFQRFPKLERPKYMTAQSWSEAWWNSYILTPQYCLVWKSNVPAVLCVSVCNFSVFEVKPFTSSTISQPKSKGKGTTQNK